MTLHRQNICVDTGPHEKILPIPIVVTKEKEGEKDEKIKLDKQNLRENQSNTITSSNKNAVTDGTGAQMTGRSSMSGPHDRGVKRDLEHSDVQYQGVGKRMKVIIPEDRKAFFAIASLLVDSNMVPKNVGITTDNFEDFIPARHHTLMQRLKEKLSWSA